MSGSHGLKRKMCRGCFAVWRPFAPNGWEGVQAGAAVVFFAYIGFDAVSTVALTLSVDFVKILELLPGGTELLLRAGFGWTTNLVGSVLTSTDAGSYAHYTLNSAVPVVTELPGRTNAFLVVSDGLAARIASLTKTTSNAPNR